jgi:trehalose 6-phosphate phosphatase
MSAIDDAVDAAIEVLGARPSLLVTDVDGTLSRIVPRPEDATVSEAAKSGLRGLVPKLDNLAVITGREESVARRMVGVEGLIYVGSYALEAVGELSFDAVRPALMLVEPHLEDLPCVELERKQVSFALHYRNCIDAERVSERLMELLEPIAEHTSTRLLVGKQVIEVAPQALPDKGTALHQLIERRRVRGVVFVGDDVADASAFRVIARRRETTGDPGLGIAVIDSETPAVVLESADLAIQGVGDVERFLNLLADRLP